MTVEELIEQLERIPDKRARVKVAIPIAGGDENHLDIERVVPENQLRFGAKIVLTP